MKQRLIKYHFLSICLLVVNSYLIAQPADNPQTFCNPLNLSYRFMVDAIDGREAADPVIVLYKDDYYLFASRSGGYWTSPDLRNWTLIIPTGLDIEAYAPAVVVMRDTLFYLPGGSTKTYITTDPKSGIWQEGPVIKSYNDPAFLYDNEQRLYMSYGVSNVTPIRVVELDPFTLKELSTPVDIISAHANIHGWERRGDDNLLDEQPWIEGSWMIKENNKIYMHYAGPGTEYKPYGDGIYVADSPLGPYEYAPYSPFAFKPTGFIAGVGHGCTFKDKNGQYWRIGTMTISIQHMFERRLGLFPVGFDEDGQIRCNTTWGDYPQYFPGVKENPDIDNFAGMMLLSNKKLALASSSLEDHSVDKSVDEEIRTYWSAQTGEPDEWLMVDLGSICSVEAIQVNFAEHGTNPDIVRGRDNKLFEQYIIEKSDDGMSWSILVDKSQNMEDVPHDYIELESPVLTRYLRLTNVYTPGEGTFAVRDLRIFGNSGQAVFTQVNDFTVTRDASDGRDALVKWTPVANADGYIIRYGISPDKLHNNFMVYDADSLSMHCLNHGVDYYFDIRAFESGTDNYNPEGEIRSFKSGNWNDLNTWARYNGTEWINPAVSIPSLSDGGISISEGHTVTFTTTDSANQVSVLPGGVLVIEKGVEFHVNDGIGTDLLIEGTLKNYGSVTNDSQATISFDKGGIYAHEQDGGVIPSAIWKPSSTCLIDSVKLIAPSNGNQNFYNLDWNCPDQTTDMTLNWNGNTIGGDITIQNTGTAKWQMCVPQAGTDVSVNLEKDIILSGGQFTGNGTENADTELTINQNGSILVSGGEFSLCSGSQGGNGTTLWNLKGNVTLANCTTWNANTSGSKLVFTNDKLIQTLAISGVTFENGGFPVEIDSGATLDMGTNFLEGNGRFILKAGATLLTAHQNGLDGSIGGSVIRSFNSSSNIGFNGTQAQVSGNLLPDTVNNLIINNIAGVTLSHSLVVQGILDMVSGIFSSGSNFMVYGQKASLRYSGKTAQTTTSSEFPSTEGPKNLIIANTGIVNLHESRKIESLDLFNKLNLGANILTADSVSLKKNTAFLVTTEGGALEMTSVGPSLVLFPIGTTSYAPVWILNNGTQTDISAGVTNDNEDGIFEGRVKLRWKLDEKESFGFGNYTIQFGWGGAAENALFRSDRVRNGKIFNMSDTTEAGTGVYNLQLDPTLKTLSRAGISKLGVFIVGSSGNITGIDKFPAVVTGDFVMHNNYPNPFIQTTSIDITINKPTEVKLVVCDMYDIEIETLINGHLLPGDYSVQWNASTCSPGIYTYKLISGNSIQSKRMILIR